MSKLMEKKLAKLEPGTRVELKFNDGDGLIELTDLQFRLPPRQPGLRGNIAFLPTAVLTFLTRMLKFFK